ncbi:hypothetical protein GCM10012275_53930 [Longimycelium tulufanense]|uniref:IrrE N-terminal-like domain-containing protein n=1 Tax=Longimycelium tulufanense TaxID=907463 RepID=A0A8J3FXS5_9PSEU|nr:hypothetical protein [Longimycelium tulufanense]GGM76389.1 hypothetical protein GCM10012275_53930 [Longimycelium tulufanense]
MPATVTKQVWQHCERIADSLHIPTPFSIEEFVNDLAQQRGREIVLMPVPSHLRTPCGMVFATQHTDYVCYVADTSNLHREHIQLHELAHLLCGHTKNTGITPEMSRLLFPNLPPEIIRDLFGRTLYNTREEQEAELLASMIRHRAGLAPAPSRDLPPEIALGLERLAAGLVPQPRRHRKRRR